MSDNKRKHSSAALALAALGVVFGDIGTSPLYALQECVSPEHGVPADGRERARRPLAHLLGAHAGRHGQVPHVHHARRQPRRGRHPRAARARARAAARRRTLGRRASLAAVVLFGAALLYGDGIITPAISVLCAVEGLEVAAPDAAAATSCRSPASSSSASSPSSAAAPAASARSSGRSWSSGSSPSALLGARYIVRAPGVLRALVADLRRRASSCATAATAFVVLGAVVLAVTGGEALYADMGHFGPRPIRIVWFVLVMPGARPQLLRPGRAPAARPGARVDNPFFAMVPAGALTYALVVLVGGGDGHRVAGAHLRRVLAHAPGDSARLLAARHRPPHLERHRGADLHPRRSTGRSAIACLALVLVFQRVDAARGGVRHRRHRHDGDHQRRLLRGAARGLEVAAVEGAAAAGALPRRSTCPSSAPTCSSSSTAATCRSSSRWSCSRSW